MHYAMSRAKRKEEGQEADGQLVSKKAKVLQGSAPKNRKSDSKTGGERKTEVAHPLRQEVRRFFPSAPLIERCTGN
jgi:hypothetical protein